uniref:Uncharacterized protein n=1 Tax=Octopus bimaculoides TaxID=37653 RepID=A0A0L8IGF6_OCTBM
MHVCMYIHISRFSLMNVWTLVLFLQLNLRIFRIGFYLSINRYMLIITRRGMRSNCPQGSTPMAVISSY